MAEGDVRETMFEFQAAGLYEKKDNLNLKHVVHGSWMKMEDHTNVEDEDAITSSSESSVGEYTTSVNSQGSTSCSSDLVDDASSSTSNSCSSNNNNNNEGPLYELSELMAHLPIKRGLSKFYQGKTQSFTSLSSVKSLEDLAKKESSTSYLYRKCKGIKGCKSYGGGLDHHKLYTLPTPTISKKVSRRSTFLNGRPPFIPLQSNFSSL